MALSDFMRDLHRELRSAFTAEEFRTLLRDRLGFRLELVVPKAADLGTQVFEAIQTAEHAGWTADLVRAAFDALPANAELARLYRGTGAAPEVVASNPSLPSTADYLDPTALGGGAPADPAAARWRLVEVEARVCRVEVGAGAAGTGFLIGPDLVLTAGHVLTARPNPQRGPAGVRCRFDYRERPDGSVIGGTVVGLDADEGIVHHSPLEGGLNYALFMLERPVGTEPTTPGHTRGWFRVPDPAPVVVLGRPVVVPHHPEGGPLKLAVGTAVGPSPTDPQRRVQYRAPTQYGSSGAPCLDENGELFAVHESRKPDDDGTVTDLREGVKIAAIRADLIAAEKGQELEWTGPREAAPAARRADAPDAKPPRPGPIRYSGNPQKDRWGGASERAGRKLSAAIADSPPRQFVCDFTVESTDGTPLEGPVVFHLDDSFPRMVNYVRSIRDGERAVLSEVIARHVFTVGAQVKDAAGQWLGLELDLSAHPDLPPHFLAWE